MHSQAMHSSMTHEAMAHFIEEDIDNFQRLFSAVCGLKETTVRAVLQQTILLSQLYGCATDEFVPACMAAAYGVLAHSFRLLAPGRPCEGGLGWAHAIMYVHNVHRAPADRSLVQRRGRTPGAGGTRGRAQGAAR
jgi:hypothetical protein